MKELSFFKMRFKDTILLAIKLSKRKEILSLILLLAKGSVKIIKVLIDLLMIEVYFYGKIYLKVL
jgi:hypothetical protein